MGKNKLYIIWVVLVLASCIRQDRTVDSSDYISYLENPKNGYIKRITYDDFEYTVQMKTKEFIAIKECQKDMSAGSSVKNRIRSLDSSVWFTIKLGSKQGTHNPLKSGTTSLTEYNDRLNYFLMEAQENIKVMYKGKPQQQIAYHFETNYGVTPFETIILGYKLDDNLYNNSIILQYQDMLFDHGKMMVEFSESELKNTPKLEL